MAGGLMRETWCEVRIIVPSTTRDERGTEYVWTREGGDLKGLQAVTVQTSVEGGVNRFALHFAPDSEFGTPSALATRIPYYSLVFITMGAEGAHKDGDDPTVIVGLTAEPQVSENWSRGAPQRRMTISGRGLETVLSDVNVWMATYYKGTDEETPASQKAAESRDRPFDLQDGHIDRFISEHKLDYDRRVWRLILSPYIERVRQHVGWLAELWRGAIDPRQAIVLLLYYYLGNKSEFAMNVGLPSAYRLRDYLIPGDMDPDRDLTDELYQSLVQFQKDNAKAQDKKAVLPNAAFVPPDWTIVEPRYRIFSTSIPPTNSSLQGILSRMLDPPFHEFYTDYVHGRARLRHRIKPFSPEPVRPGETAFNTPGRAERWNAKRERNLEGRIEPVPQSFAETVRITSADVLAAQLTLGQQPYYNAFQILNEHGGNAGAKDLLQTAIKPVISATDHWYTNMVRYGPRPFAYGSPYFVHDWGMKETHSKDRILIREERELAHRLGELLQAWHDPHPRMYVGSLTLVGRAEFRHGRRLVWEGRDQFGRPDGRGTREFYIQSVSQTYDFNTGTWTTSVNVSRGWDIANPV